MLLLKSVFCHTQRRSFAQISHNQKKLAFPIIDFEKFLIGNAMDKKNVGEEVLDAFKNHGFIYMANHGIPATTLNKVFEHSEMFFNLPEQEKNKWAWVSPESNRGYVAPGREKVTQLLDHDAVQALRDSSPDLKESMEIGKEPSTNYQNNWPESFPSFRTSMMSFYDTAHELHLELMDAIGQGLGFKSRYFDQFCNAKDHNLRLLHYPSVEKSLLDKDGQTRAGAHTDYGTVTLLFQDDKGGLQVRSQDGSFIPAPPIKGTIVINAGDLLSRWSNDIIKSTEHQVVSPPTSPEDTHYPARYSIAYFCNPNWDATISCFDSCWSESKPKKYAPVKSHDYLVSRLAATY